MVIIGGGDMYQFGHIAWAARTRTQKRSSSGYGSMRTRSTGWSAQDLADEAERAPHACEHIASPQPPTIVFGISPSNAVAEAITWAEQAKEGRGKKLRKTSPVIAAGVISLPSHMADVWPAYRDTAIAALHDRYGDRLRSVVEHLDETHPHLHFYLVPTPGEAFGAVHEGYNARQKERAKGPGAKVRTAYQDAMKAWQIWLYERVSKQFGLARTGPQRQRLSRDEYMRQQAIARARAELEAAQRSQSMADQARLAARAMCEASRSAINEMEQQKVRLAGALREVRRERRELERIRKNLTAEQRDRLEALREREDSLKVEREKIRDERENARREGMRKGLAQAAAVRLGDRIGLGIATVKEKLGVETARERSAREALERAVQHADSAKIAQREAEHALSLLRQQLSRMQLDHKKALDQKDTRIEELMHLYADADSGRKALLRVGADYQIT